MSGEKKSSRTPFLLLSAIAFIVLGIVVIMFRDPIADMVNNIFKWAAAGILGLIAIINIIAFAKNTKENIKELIIGALSLIAAVILLISDVAFKIENLLLMVIGIMFGLYLIVEGFFKLKAAFASKKNSVKAWFVPLILGLLSIVLGVLIIYLGLFTTKVFVIIFGIVLIYAGVQNIVNMFFISKD